VVAFELLSGRRPFENESMTAEAAAHVNAPVPSISELCEHLPLELDPVFRKALAKNPEERFPDCAEFVACLRQAVAEAAGMTRRFEPVAAAAPVRVRRGRRGPLVPLLLGLALLAALAGAILAVVLTGGGHKASVKTVTHTIVKTGPGGATVTQLQVSTAPAASPPPPATTESLVPPSGAKPSVGQAKQLTDQATAYMRAGNYTAALPVAQQALRGLSGSGDIYEAYANYDLGNTLLNLGRCRAAVTYLQRAAQLEPNRTEPKHDLARARACS
jgi:serine/threonine-protein kinase